MGRANGLKKNSAGSNNMKSTFLALFVFCSIISRAQDKPIGYWESLLPYNNSMGVATDGSTLFNICYEGFFTYTKGDVPTPFSKETGMSDIGMQSVGFDKTTGTAILAYSNGNIDLFKNNTFYNIPDLKLKNIAGAKKVYHIYTENGLAYLSSSLGVIVVDIADHSIKETYKFYNKDSFGNFLMPVIDFSALGSYYYAVTDKGIYRAEKSNNDLINYQVWTKIDSTRAIERLATLQNKLFLADSDKVYTLNSDTLQLVYQAPARIQHISAGLSNLLIGEAGLPHFGNLKLMDMSYNIVDSFDCHGPTIQAVQNNDSSLWIASTYSSLIARTDKNSVGAFLPPGPSDAFSFDIYARNSELYIAHGTYNSAFYPGNNFDGISYLHGGKWKHYKGGAFSPFDTLQNFSTVLKDEIDGTLYFGSYAQGLFILKPNGAYQHIDQNSILDESPTVNAGSHLVIGMALDNSDNLWVSTLFSKHILYLKTADSTWFKINTPGVSQGGPIVIDDNNQVWMGSIAGGGVIVYNTNNTIKDLTDDKFYHLQAGAGNGNIPGANVNCLAKDLNNAIWIGTDDGIAIASNCYPPFTSTNSSPPCDAQIPIVQYDKYAGFLFKGSNVRAIAVDGANRKWVGTDDGVWLLSPDASKVIYKFTVDNSPLPSNSIRKITIDNTTGEVYIGTERGLVKYRSNATEGGTTNQNVTAFPNPVPSGYNGTIAIKGLVADGDVKITDINGQLVCHTTALGGQAVWNGKDYTGRRPQSGVYLYFVTNTDGSQTYAGKIVFIQ